MYEENLKDSHFGGPNFDLGKKINYGFILKCFFESEKMYNIFFKKIVWSYAESGY